MPDVVFDPYSYETHEDPYPIYRRMRDEAPLYRNDEHGFWALSRHEDVSNGFRDYRRFSNRHGVALEAMGPGAGATTSFLGMDPPRHDRLRSLVSRAFTPRRVRELEQPIRALATHYIDAFVEKGECDFIEDFAGRLPMDVVSEILGLPSEDRRELRRLSDLVVERKDGEQSVPPAAAQASLKLLQYYQTEVEARRAAGADRDTLTDQLIRTEVDGDRLDDREIVSFLFLMVVAGNETTTKLLGNALYWSWRNPEVRERVAADPALIPGWVEETLRYDASSQVLYRLVEEDVEMYGRTMRAGDVLALVIGAANRDERAFEDPDRYDVERDNRSSLAFGQGTHFCLGASLARLEGIVSLEEVVRRLPDYEIDTEGLVRIHSSNVRGYAHVPIRFTPGARS